MNIEWGFFNLPFEFYAFSGGFMEVVFIQVGRMERGKIALDRNQQCNRVEIFRVLENFLSLKVNLEKKEQSIIVFQFFCVTLACYEKNRRIQNFSRLDLIFILNWVFSKYLKFMKKIKYERKGEKGWIFL